MPAEAPVPSTDVCRATGIPTPSIDHHPFFHASTKTPPLLALTFCDVLQLHVAVCQVESRLFRSLERWLDPRYSPCLKDRVAGSGDGGSDAAIGSSAWVEVSVLMYHPGSLSEKEEAVRAKWMAVRPALGCFSGGGTRGSSGNRGAVEMAFLYARLPNTIADSHPAGPCAQFYALLELLRPRSGGGNGGVGSFGGSDGSGFFAGDSGRHGVDFAFIMEPDALPIRPGWLELLLARELGNAAGGLQPVFSQFNGTRSSSSSSVNGSGENGSGGRSPVGCHDFWVKGSVSRCEGQYGRIDARGDKHVNGNALFCLGDPAFHAFLGRVRRFFPAFTAAGVGVAGCSTGRA